MNSRTKKALRFLYVAACGIVLVLLMLYMGGVFIPNKIGPDDGVQAPEKPPPPKRTVLATVKRITEYHEAVGTVRPQRETSIEAQVTGRIMEIRVGPGDKVYQGDVLIVLDSRELRSRLDQAREDVRSSKARMEQARQALAAAEAVHDRARSAFRRIKTYFDSEAATPHDLEAAESEYLQASAGLKQAKYVLKETEAGVNRAGKIVEQNRIAMGYTRISAPEQGEVVKRLAEPGDLAWPGKGLLVLQTRSALRLEALIPEGLIRRITPGASLEIVVNALDGPLKGTVEEVVPAADPRTRTFLVKAGLPREEGLFPGMFGRLRIPVRERDVVLIPRAAVRRIGQLEVVTVKSNGSWQQTYVKTGRAVEEKVEILSGLSGGETLALRGDNDA